MIKRTAQSLRKVLRPIASPIGKFMELEAASGVMLLLGMIIALVWANLNFHSYHDFVDFPIGFYLGHLHIEQTLHFWVNDFLMAIFFFNVTLEIKREFTVGELSTRKKAALPMIAALGGMVVPAVVYLWFNPSGAVSRGWGIPMATDIAFAVGVLTLLGKRVPFSLKVFLLTLAVADDLGGIIAIALFYTDTLNWTALAMAIVFFTIAKMINEAEVRNPWPYIAVGLASWLCVLFSGVHATISGVALAFIAPVSLPMDPALLDRRLHLLHRWVNFFILPLFALLNTGVVIESLNVLGHPIAMGVFFGLVLGKPAGIFLATWLGVLTGAGELPGGVRLSQVLGVGFVAGIGFTVATFISTLALKFDSSLEVYAKMGILTASVVAAVLGVLVLCICCPRRH